MSKVSIISTASNKGIYFDENWSNSLELFKLCKIQHEAQLNSFLLIILENYIHK